MTTPCQSSLDQLYLKLSQSIYCYRWSIHKINNGVPQVSNLGPIQAHRAMGMIHVRKSTVNG